MLLLFRVLFFGYKRERSAHNRTKRLTQWITITELSGDCFIGGCSSVASIDRRSISLMGAFSCGCFAAIGIGVYYFTKF